MLVWPDLTLGIAGSRDVPRRRRRAADRVARLVDWLVVLAHADARNDERARHHRASDARRRADDDGSRNGARRVEQSVLHTRTTVALVYLSTIGAVGGFVAYTYALRHLPVSFVSLYAYINPVIAVALGVLVLGEPFTTAHGDRRRPRVCRRRRRALAKAAGAADATPRSPAAPAPVHEPAHEERRRIA